MSVISFIYLFNEFAIGAVNNLNGHYQEICRKNKFLTLYEWGMIHLGI